MRAAVNAKRQLCRRCRDRILISTSILLAFNFLNLDIHFLFDNRNRYYLRSLDQSSITNKWTTEFTDRNQYGTWIGNNWVPPAGKKHYSATEMKMFFQKHSVLWIGDSTGRRAYNTLYGILSSDETHIPVEKIDAQAVIDASKFDNTERCEKPALGTLNICRTIPGTAPEDFKRFDYRSAACFRDIATLAASDDIKKEITKDYSLLIVSLGVWETVRKNDCTDKNNTSISFPNSTYESLTKALDDLCRLQGPSLAVVWRTSGFQDNDIAGNVYLEDINERSMGHIDSFNEANRGNSNITYVDWGTEVLPRSNGVERIKGDIRPHYGLEARLLFLQLLMNELNPINGLV
jgi:hypothetical protein